MTGIEGLKDKRILVTGGTKGIGLAIAQCFLETGAKVVVCARNPPESLPHVKDAEALFHQTDIRDAQSRESLVAFVQTALGGLDVLINNAGGSPPVEAATVSPRFSQAIIELNLLAPLHLSQGFNSIMQKQESGGLIINIASISGLRPSPGTAAYGAAKAGLINLTQSLAMEWAPRVRLLSVSPGPILTDEFKAHLKESDTLNKITDTIPLGRLGTPKEVADICVFAASTSGTYLSGTNIRIDGGGEFPPTYQRVP